MRCLAKDCGTTFSSHPHLKFFRFPRLPECHPRIAQWLKVAGEPVFWKGGSLCERHFAPESLYMGRTRLVRDGVPSYPTGPLNANGLDYSPANPLPSESQRSTAVPIPQEIPSTTPTSSSSTPPCGHDEAHGLSTPRALTPPVSCKTPCRPAKSRVSYQMGARRFTDMTPRKELLRILKKKDQLIKILEKKVSSQRERISSLGDLDKAGTRLVRRVADSNSVTAATLLSAQVRCTRRAPRGRRWSAAEKVLASAIFKKSPEVYSFLRTFLCLPSVHTLKRPGAQGANQVPFRPGINRHGSEKSSASVGKMKGQSAPLNKIKNPKSANISEVLGNSDSGRSE